MKGLVVNGWNIFAHPLLTGQLERLTRAVEAQRIKSTDAYLTGADAKLLGALSRLMFETIPQDPTRPDYRQGGTLGKSHKHWFRAKFGNGRFRLFFRYDSRSKVIVYAWVNDADSLRTYGAKSDAYAVFRRMLDKGDPPESWEDLTAASSPMPGPPHR